MEFIRFFLKHKVTFLMLLLVSIALARLQAFTLVMIITEVVCLGMCVMCMLAYTSHAFRKQPIVTLLLKKAKKT
jgi:phosphoglycerol transferase MdoB-like AlkP superfamily enzyme